MENGIETMTEQVVEVAEEVVTPTSGKVLKTVAVVGLTILVGRIAYKKVIKPMIAAAKAKKEADDIYEADTDESDDE